MLPGKVLSRTQRQRAGCEGLYLGLACGPAALWNVMDRGGHSWVGVWTCRQTNDTSDFSRPAGWQRHSDARWRRRWATRPGEQNDSGHEGRTVLHRIREARTHSLVWKS